MIRNAAVFLTKPWLGKLQFFPGFRIRIHFIRIRNFRLNTDPDPDPIRIRIQSESRALMTKNWIEKNYSWKKIYFFLSKTTIYLSPGLHKERPSYRRSLQLSKEVIQHFKTWTFTIFFLLLWVIFALLDPDPDPLTQLNLDPIRICNPGFFTKLWLGKLQFCIKLRLCGVVPYKTDKGNFNSLINIWLREAGVS